METNKYSEEDIQDYASGNFRGNQTEFETFLKLNPWAERTLTEYRQLFNTLKNQEIPALSFNLADNVIIKVEQKQKSLERRHFKILTGVLIIIAVGAFVTTLRQLNFGLLIFSANASLLPLSAVLILLFSFAFYRLDIKQMEKRFTS